MTESTYNELVNTLTRHQVSLVDAAGEYRSTYDIIKDISEAWDDMTSMEQSGLATAAAGTRQQAIFFSLVEQFQEAEGAMNAMATSEGELEESYDIYLQSIQARTQQIKVAWQALGESVISTDLMNMILGLAEGFTNATGRVITFVDNTVGLNNVLSVLISLLAGFLSMKIAPSIAAMGKGIQSLIGTLSTAVKATQVLFMSEQSRNSMPGFLGLSRGQSFAKVFADAHIGLNGVTTAVTLGTLALSTYLMHQQKVKQEAIELKQAIDEETKARQEQANSVEDLIAKYKDLAANGIDEDESKEAVELQEQITDLMDDIPGIQDSIAQSVDVVNGKYEEQLGLLRDIHQQSLDNSIGQLEASAGNANKTYDLWGESEDVDMQGFDELENVLAALQYEDAELSVFGPSSGGKTRVSRVNLDKLEEFDAAEALSRLQNIKSFLDKSDLENSLFKNKTYNADNIIAWITHDIAELQRVVTERDNLNKQLQEAYAARDAYEIQEGGTITSEQDYANLMGRITKNGYNKNTDEDYINKLKEALAELYPEYDKVIDAEGAYRLNTNRMEDELSIAHETVGEMADSFSAMQEAITEANTSGRGLSYDTIEKLAKADENWMDYIEIENGMLKLNSKAWDENNRARLDSKIENTEAAMAAVRKTNEDLIRDIPSLREYAEVVSELTEAGVDVTQTQFGNVDIESHMASVAKELQELSKSGADVESTVLSTTPVSASVKKVKGVDIAFTPVLETDNGVVKLTDSEVTSYISGIMNKIKSSGGVANEETILRFDAEGLEVDGIKVSNIIAAVGDEASKTANVLNILGDNKSLAVLRNQMLEEGKAANRSEDAVKNFVSTYIGNLQDLENAANALDLYRILSENVNESGPFDIINSIATIGENIDSLSSAIQEFNDDGAASAKTISGLFSVFGSFSSFGNYVNVLSNTSSTIDQVKAATDALAEEYLNSTFVLQNLTDENAQAVTTMLTKIGVTNAEALVQAKLTAIKIQAMYAEIDFNSASGETIATKLEEIATLAAAAGQMDVYKTAMFQAKVATTDFNTATLTSIGLLRAQAEQVGATSRAKMLLQKIEWNREQLESGNLSKQGIKDTEKAIDYYQKKLMEEMGNQKFEFNPEDYVVDVPETPSGSGGSGSGAAEVEEYIAEIEKFRKETEALERAQFESQLLDSKKGIETNLADQVEYEQKLIESRKKEQDYLHQLVEARRAYIASGEGVQKLLKAGFQVDYDLPNNKFFVKNMEHVNDLVASSAGEYDSVQEATNEMRKEYEELIQELEGYNDENIQNTEEWWSLQQQILESQKAIYQDQITMLENELNLSKTHFDNAAESLFKNTRLKNDWYSWSYLADSIGVTTDEILEYSQAIDEMPESAKSALQMRGESSLKAAQELYDQTMAEAEQFGTDQYKTAWGNINTANRGMLEWNDENLEKYKDELSSWGKSMNEVAGTSSSLMSGTMSVGGVGVAFTPMLQTSDGLVLLDSSTVTQYIYSLFEKAGENTSKERLLTLDATGMEINGQYIYGLLADVGDEVERTAKAMEFGGSGGKLEATRKALQEFAGAAMVTADDVRELAAQNSALAGYMAQTGFTAEQVAQRFNTFSKAITEASSRTGQSITNMGELVNGYNNWQAVSGLWYVNELKQFATEAIDKEKAIQDKLHEYAEYLRSKGYDDNSQEISDLQNQWQEAQNNIESIKESWVNAFDEMVNSANEALDTIQGVFDTLTGAADEYATNGGFLSLDTYQDIINLGPEYMTYLEDENGLLVINKERVQDVMAAKARQLALDASIAYLGKIQKAVYEGDTEEMMRLASATTEATNASYDLIYAQIMSQNVSAELRNAWMENIDRMRAMAEAAVEGIYHTGLTAEEELDKMDTALNDILKYVIAMLEDRLRHIKEHLEDLKEQYQEIIELKKESLEETEKEDDYQDQINEKVKEMAKLQERINALSLDDSRDANAQRAELEEQMADLQKELTDTQHDYAVEQQQQSLDDQLEAYQKEKDEEIEKLDEVMNSEQEKYDAAIEYIRSHWATLYEELIQYNTNCGLKLVRAYGNVRY